ncbi:MAG: leucine--tRNA ligase [Anaerolineales bacterium]|nr:leucine--tRNA ligase [Anaerolineales bacterium]HNQ93538.1 leucine--tRNA ligase [Anaerolineales bacterium]
MATKKKKTTIKKKTALKARKTLKPKVSPAKKKVVAVKKKVTKPVSKAKKSAPVKRRTEVRAPESKDRSFNPQAFEPKWQAKWEADKLYRAVIDESRPKHYALTMLPYPSGDLHIGHWYAMTPSDARARFKRMQGYNVMFPMGFDAFGLPAEGAAIKHNIHPKKWTYANIERMRAQMRSMGAMFDWEREAVSSDPEYYKWTQWFFIQLYKHGLAYRKKQAVDWCPKDNTTLAREQVKGEDRVCDRCGTPVIKKELEQWFFKATKYADELLHFEGLDWPDSIETSQTNWIGRSEGASVIFKTEVGDPIEIFTTRPDTLWGATFMVFSPEHPLVDKITTAENAEAIRVYKAEAEKQTDIQREAKDKEKTGVFTGGYAVNPVNEERIPIWVADYVLMSYGTGAIMAVPAHDERDFEFARKFGLKIVPVIQPVGADGHPPLQEQNGETMTEAYPHDGVIINSGPFNGTRATNDKGMKNPAIKAVIEYLEQKGIGKRDVNYRYRDWLISRQRFWGAPIPMVHCDTHGWNPVPDTQLPVLLPDDITEWKPTGESPLKFHPTWKDAVCPVCGEHATRETDTMDTFMCSSWYHLRYLSPHNDNAPFDDAEYNYWMPVDTYTGGSEHANMHLLYFRFFHKALRDMGITEGGEPVMQLRNQGMVLAEDNSKMSKSKDNVVAPDVLVKKYGADTVRAYLMFFARWQQGAPWDSHGIEGTARWMRRVWTLFTDPASPSGTPASADVKKNLRRRVHQTLKRVTHDFENFEFNTIISSLMELLNEMYKAREAGAVGTDAWNEAVEIYLKMIAPVTPHIAEELWTNHLGKPYSIHQQKWPHVDEAAAREDSIEIPVQVNGKVRDRIVVAVDASEEEIRTAALASEIIQKYLEGKEPRKVIVAHGKLVSVVV